MNSETTCAHCGCPVSEKDETAFYDILGNGPFCEMDFDMFRHRRLIDDGFDLLDGSISSDE